MRMPDWWYLDSSSTTYEYSQTPIYWVVGNIPWEYEAEAEEPVKEKKLGFFND